MRSFPQVNAVKVLSSKDKVQSTQMDFICQISFLGVCQGFHEKMIRDTIDTVKTLPRLSSKQKQREIKRMYEYDPFVLKCTKVVDQCQELLKSFREYVGDEDLKRIWLMIDKFLQETVLKGTFISAIGSFSLISCDLIEQVQLSDTNILEGYKNLQAYLYDVGLEISDEYFEMKKEKAEKQGAEYDHFVFQFFEDVENQKAVKYGEHFLEVFSSREIFQSYAQKHFDSLQGEDRQYFDTVFKKLNAVSA